MVRFISIDGNIGSGKSTLLKKLNVVDTDKKCIVLQEPVSTWQNIRDENKNILEYYYEDQNRWAFPFQMMAYITRLADMRKAIADGYEVIISERSLLTDKFVFAQMLYDEGKISHIEYQIYQRWFNEFLGDFHQDFHVVYLKTNPQIAHDRIKKRGRKGENIPLEYLHKCDQYHEKWLQSFKNVQVLDGNVDENHDPECFNRWLTTIKELL